jgi:aminoglycoside phosphotransferase (APT) family kinase protein
MEQDIALTGGRTTANVVRIGHTVRRPVKPRAAFVHELLCHLEKCGFGGAPQFLGIDAAGREMLSFLSGTVPAELGDFSDTQVRAAARLLRGLHDATADSRLCAGHEVICHGDASPCNCVFVDGMPAALIDFDAAHPGSRLEDVGYAAWLWLDIGNDDLAVERQGERIAAFFEGYGIDAAEAVTTIVLAQVALAGRATLAGVREWADNCRAWVEQNRSALSAAVAAR